MSALFILVGIVMQFFGLIPFLNWYNSRKWKVAMAKINHVFIDEGPFDPDYEGQLSEISFSYNVNGKQYITSNMQFGQYSFLLGLTEDDVRRFDISKEYPIYYNPKSPGHSVIKRKVHFASYFLFVAGLALSMHGVDIL